LNNKIHLALFTSFKNLDKIIVSYKFILNQFSKNFKNLYIINSDYLKFFPKKYKNYKYSNFKNDLNNKINFINPKNYNEFKNFIEKKKLVLIDTLGNSFSEMKVRYLINKKNIDTIMISNIGNIQGSTKPIFSKFISYYFYKKVPYIITLILYGIGIFKKIKVRFVTNKDIFSNFKKKKFSYTEKVLPINSRAFDESKLFKKKIKNNFITFLNPDLNHPEWIIKRGHIEKDIEKKIYKIFQNFLDSLSKYYNKKIVVCIHPLNNLKKIKNLFKNYKVVQFKTAEYVRNSHLVVFFDSSSIVDAIILKKRIICIKKIQILNSVINFVPAYHNQGLFEISLDSNFKLNLSELDKRLVKSFKNYKKFNNRFGISDGKKVGVYKLINYINRNF
jgi:hypothetical protein